MASQASMDYRREPRFPAGCRAMARLAVSVEITNASAQGVRGRTVLPLAVGTLLKLTLPGSSERHARVAWVEGEEFGCEFMKPLTGNELRELIEATQHAAPYALSE